MIYFKYLRFSYITYIALFKLCNLNNLINLITQNNLNFYSIRTGRCRLKNHVALTTWQNILKNGLNVLDTENYHKE